MMTEAELLVWQKERIKKDNHNISELHVFIGFIVITLTCNIAGLLGQLMSECSLMPLIYRVCQKN